MYIYNFVHKAPPDGNFDKKYGLSRHIKHNNQVSCDMQ